MKIRRRLTLWFTGLVCLIVVSASVTGWLGVHSYIYRQAETELTAKRHEVQAVIDSLSAERRRQGLNFELHHDATSLQNIFANERTFFYDNLFIQISDNRGAVIARSRNLGKNQLPLQTNAREKPYLQLPLQLGEHRIQILYSSSVIQVSGKIQGQLQLGLSMNKTEQLMNRLLLLEIFGLLVSLLAALLGGQFLAQRALEPMLRITSQVQAMAGQDLFQRLDTRQLNQDEIGHLAETFNGLLQRIEEVFLAQQRFLTDASHEFKTPLTAIRGHAQLIEKRGKDADVRLKSAATIIRESRRMSRLVEDLLLLARLESVGQYERLDLTRLLDEVYEDLEPLHPEFRLALEPGELMVLGHGDSLRRVLINLLSNAFQALRGQDGDEVLLSLRQTGGMAEIRVNDNGWGIGSEHLPHLFERFYRVNPDRSRSSGGSGIGLALVYEIVRLHQGSVEVTSSTKVGTCFTVRLPLQADVLL